MSDCCKTKIEEELNKIRSEKQNLAFDKQSFTCPMHPEIVRDMPGMCPECGMNLVPGGGMKQREHDSCHGEKEKKHDKHEGHSTKMFLRKFWISLAVSIPVTAYSAMIMDLTGFMPPEFPGSRYIPALLGTFLFFYAGSVFLQSAWREIKAKLPGMMTLIALAISAAFLHSIYVTLIGRGETLFWELATLITIMLLGHYIEMKAVSGAQGALRELSKLLPDKAEVVRDGKTETISVSELKEGDVVLVRPGGRVPADGVVTQGDSEVNESMVTGESIPVEKRPGSELIAGTINGMGALQAKVTRVGDKTFLSGVMRLVAEAQASKSRLQILSDRAAFYLTIVALLTGTITFFSWLIVGAGINSSLERLVAVLVIACPHALGLAVPLVASISTTLSARNGFLVKQRLALESARKVDTVIFDKTGTLTSGEYGVSNIWGVGVSADEALSLAAAVDSQSEHIVSRAIVERARDMKLEIPGITNFKKISGKGASAEVNGRKIFVGGEALLEETGSEMPDSQEVLAEAGKGKTIIYVMENRKVLGVISLADKIRGESREAVSMLKSMGVSSVMITGDSEEVAKWVADEVGIEKYFAKVLPGEKAEKVRELQKEGRKVAMVGDGVNDAPALTEADLGIAIGAGTNIAVESAGIILMRNDPRDILKIIKLSRFTYSKMVQNLFWATGYNVIAIPLAAGALAFKGILLPPALAAIFMSFSTIIVAVNAILLRRQKL